MALTPNKASKKPKKYASSKILWTSDGRRIRGEAAYHAVTARVIKLTKFQTHSRYWKEQGILPFDFRRAAFNFTDRSLARIFDISKTTANTYIRRWIKEGILIPSGELKRSRRRYMRPMRALLVAPVVKMLRLAAYKRMKQWTDFQLSNVRKLRGKCKYDLLNTFLNRNINNHFTYGVNIRWLANSSPQVVLPKRFFGINGNYGATRIVELSDIDMRLTKTADRLKSRRPINRRCPKYISAAAALSETVRSMVAESAKAKEEADKSSRNRVRTLAQAKMDVSDAVEDYHRAVKYCGVRGKFSCWNKYGVRPEWWPSKEERWRNRTIFLNAAQKRALRLNDR